MNEKFLAKKFLLVIKNTYDVASCKEKIELLIFPLIISISMFFILPKMEHLSKEGNLNQLTENFLSFLATTSGIMTAFGLATVTILTTTSSNSIKEAKKRITERKMNGIEINYFELLLIRNFYNILVQITVLFISILFIFLSNLNIENKWILSIGLFFILHSLGSLILTVISIYHLMWKD